MTRSAFGREKGLKTVKNEGWGRKKFLKKMKKVFLGRIFENAIW